MRTQLNKNSIKTLISMAGVVGASVFLSLPGLALTNTNASSSNQLSDNHTYRTESNVSSRDLLAQSGSGGGSSTSGGSNRANQTTTSGSNRGTGMNSPANSNGGGMRAVTGGDSVRGINWICLNNPRCGNGMR
jgi:hypothetical protein